MHLRAIVLAGLAATFHPSSLVLAPVLLRQAILRTLPEQDSNSSLKFWELCSKICKGSADHLLSSHA